MTICRSTRRSLEEFTSRVYQITTSGVHLKCTKLCDKVAPIGSLLQRVRRHPCCRTSVDLGFRHECGELSVALCVLDNNTTEKHGERCNEERQFIFGGLGWFRESWEDWCYRDDVGGGQEDQQILIGTRNGHQRAYGRKGVRWSCPITTRC